MYLSVEKGEKTNVGTNFYIDLEVTERKQLLFMIHFIFTYPKIPLNTVLDASENTNQVK